MNVDECGLINSSGMLYTSIKMSFSTNLFNNDNVACNVECDSEKEIKITNFALTSSGKELSKVLGVHSRNDFLIDFAKELKKQYKDIHIHVYRINFIDETGGINCNILNDLIADDACSNNLVR